MTGTRRSSTPLGVPTPSVQSTVPELHHGTYVISAALSSEAAMEEVADCFAANGDPKDPRVMRWLYMDNVVHRNYVEVARENGQTAGVYILVPGRARVAGRTREMAQSLDTLTDSHHRGQGLFPRLAASVYDRAHADGLSFVYGFPNGNSAPGFFNKLGWIKLDPIPFLIRPLRSRYFANRLDVRLSSLPDIPLPLSPVRQARARLEKLERFDERHELLWRRYAQGIGVAVERTAEYLNWRLVDKPGAEYRRVQLNRDGRIVGFAAYRVVRKHGGTIGYLMELVADDREPRAADNLLWAVLHGMRRAGADAALAWNFPHSPHHSTYRRAAFLPLPERLRPIELHFGVLPLDDADAPTLGTRDAWYLSYCDSDTV